MPPWESLPFGAVQTRNPTSLINTVGLFALPVEQCRLPVIVPIVPVESLGTYCKRLTSVVYM